MKRATGESSRAADRASPRRRACKGRSTRLPG
nr:MAG TPA: hypothetical protein [Caudoviricetes sp.]